jgi:hypothetical protein
VQGKLLKAMSVSQGLFFSAIFDRATDRTAERKMLVDGSNDVFPRKEVPFGGVVNMWPQLWAWFPSKTPNFPHVTVHGRWRVEVIRQVSLPFYCNASTYMVRLCWKLVKSSEKYIFVRSVKKQQIFIAKKRQSRLNSVVTGNHRSKTAKITNRRGYRVMCHLRGLLN